MHVECVEGAGVAFPGQMLTLCVFSRGKLGRYPPWPGKVSVLLLNEERLKLTLRRGSM